MANKSRFNTAKKAIVAFFDTQEQRVYRERELAQIVTANCSAWRLGPATGIGEFLELMLEDTSLQAIEIPVNGVKKMLYSWGQATAFELAAGLVPRAYLSHHTALYLHELTKQIPTQLFVNQEQSAKAVATVPLTQADLDAAFARPQLSSNSRGSYDGYTLVMLHGQHTGQLGVETQILSGAGRIAMTSLERTLIDVTVRPEYAGGVHQILEAYQQAANKVSINRLLSLLAKLAYRYPYHQAIGFYMKQAGNYKPAQLNLLRKLDQKLDFYLAHDLHNTAYSAEWRLWYPPGLAL
jgi:hypothetical protein